MEDLDDEGKDDEQYDDSTDADEGEIVGILGRAPIKSVRGVEELELDDGLSCETSQYECGCGDRPRLTMQTP